MATASEAGGGTRPAKPEGEKPAKTRRPRKSAEDTAIASPRFFLGKTNGDGGLPALDREVSTEGEALVEALRQGVTFYTVQEYRVVPDFAAKAPRLLKEPASSK
jgi:hypothetical protein